MRVYVCFGHFQDKINLNVLKETLRLLHIVDPDPSLLQVNTTHTNGCPHVRFTVGSFGGGQVPLISLQLGSPIHSRWRCTVFYRSSMNFSSSLFYSRSFVGSDQMVCSSIPMTISEPQASRTPLLLLCFSFLGALLVGSDEEPPQDMQCC